MRVGWKYCFDSNLLDVDIICWGAGNAGHIFCLSITCLLIGRLRSDVIFTDANGNTSCGFCGFSAVSVLTQGSHNRQLSDDGAEWGRIWGVPEVTHPHPPPPLAHAACRCSTWIRVFMRALSELCLVNRFRMFFFFSVRWKKGVSPGFCGMKMGFDWFLRCE